ncbi:unnamed protein product [Onchocerca ochengi]|uniref:Late endosomal/lysosomal adaptor and MAPK and MTOR activator 5 n=1 Tax=Onchocerca ochengi TaxID=42157 RepID=A0A182EEC5_ONCOC|nr:unnamed protein product [Onchocerca ochengi]
MESQLEKLADEMMSNEKVKGMLCVDESGLNVCSRGTLNNASGDAAVDLLKLANNLEPDLPISSIIIELTAIKNPEKVAELKDLLRILCHKTSCEDECRLLVNQLDHFIEKLEPYFVQIEIGKSNISIG